MALYEKKLEKEIMLEHSKEGRGRLFRNHVGNAWHGNLMDRFQESGWQHVILRHPRKAQAGLCVGSSDLIGWTVVDGKAVFTAIELKSPKGLATQEQKNFIAAVQASGGIAGIARNIEDYRKLVSLGTTF